MGETREILAVPEKSVMNLSGTTVVFVKTTTNTFVHRIVKTGAPIGSQQIEIKEGLSAGDIIVSEGNYQLLTASN